MYAKVKLVMISDVSWSMYAGPQYTKVKLVNDSRRILEFV